MIKYWIEFEQTLSDNPPPGTLIGVGITVCCKEQALKQIKEKIFEGSLPVVKSVKAGVSLIELDQDHVVPNMSDYKKEGIWFPLGYD